jgi:hypothetical protein
MSEYPNYREHEQNENLYGLGWKYDGTDEEEYNEMNPVNRFDEKTIILGEPDFLDHEAGGNAVWFKRTLSKREDHFKCLERVEIKDMKVRHDHPATHFDFMTFEFKIPSEKLNNALVGRLRRINRISKSIWADLLTGTISVRCHFDGANWASLYTVLMFLDRRTEIKEAIDNYPEMIFATIPDHPSYDENAIEKYVNYICEFHQNSSS